MNMFSFLDRFTKTTKFQYNPKYKYNKVFGIGYPKTGSSSCAGALRTMGFTVLHDQLLHFPGASSVADVNSDLDGWDASFNVYQQLFTQFDRQYPNSKFILTVRSSDGWLQSLKNWRFNDICTIGQFNYHNFKNYMCTTNDPAHIATILQNIALFGYMSASNDQVLIERYESHNAAVIEYFKKKPEQLLVLKLESKYKYQQLSEFLNKPLPNLPYPHEKKLKTAYID